MFNSISSKFYNSARFLQNHWTKNDFKNGDKYCAIGEARRQGMEAEMIPFLWASLPKKHKGEKSINNFYCASVTRGCMRSRVIYYNDAHSTRKRNIINLFKRAAKLAGTGIDGMSLVKLNG